jgi:phage anti-repressor protein
MKDKIKVEFPGFAEMFDKLIAEQKNNKKEVMTKKKLFIQFIESYQESSKISSELYSKYKIDLFDYEDRYHVCISNLMSMFFSEEDKDWIDWWLYERISHSGKINKANYKNGDEIILDTPEDLWNFILKNNKSKKPLK